MALQGTLGSGQFSGLRREGDAYVNSLYGKSPITLNITLDGGMGDLRVDSSA